MLSSTVKAWVLGLSIAFGGIALPQRVVASTHNSSSATTQRARRHFLAGKRAFEAKRYAAALKEFEAGYAIDPRPGFLLNMGHASRRMGDLRRARDYYLKFLESDPPAVGPPHDDRAGRRDRPPARRGADVRNARVGRARAGRGDAAAGRRRRSRARRGGACAARSSPRSQRRQQARAETESPRPRLHLEPAVAVRVTSRAEIARSEPLVATPVAREERSPPIYRRWWFWAAAGAAAGVATAITVGALGSGSSARDSGTWGQIRL